MFDIGWSELLILGVIALIVVGPKELPGLLRTIGRYAGVMKKHAADFRQQFDQVMKEAELDQLKKDLTGFKTEMETAAREALLAAEKQAESAKSAVNAPIITVVGAPKPSDAGSALAPSSVAETAGAGGAASVAAAGAAGAAGEPGKT